MDTGNGTLRSALASAFAAVLEPQTAVYAAVPVTSGLRLWKLAGELKVPDLRQISRIAPHRYQNEVFVPNCNYAAEFASEARSRHGLVIDPSRLVVQDWSQSQYWHFWEEIILRYARAVLLSPDWAYSKGCVYECMFAVQHSIPLLSPPSRELTIAEVRAKVSHAIQDRESLGIDAGFLDEFMEATRKVTSRR